MGEVGEGPFGKGEGGERGRFCLQGSRMAFRCFRKDNRTKRNKNRQRNERDKKKSEETAKDQSRISRYSKKESQVKCQGLKVTSVQSLKAHLEF
ncbi:hypothetical protein Tco_1150079 [Tanacetum coccineum]